MKATSWVNRIFKKKKNQTLNPVLRSLFLVWNTVEAGVCLIMTSNGK